MFLYVFLPNPNPWCTNRHMSTQSPPNTQSLHLYKDVKVCRPT